MIQKRNVALARSSALAIALASAVFLGSCAVLGAASKATMVFASEEDPELAAGALPTFIKASEMFLAADPKDREKVVATASLYVMYANAFVDGPASYLPDDRFEERKVAADRASALYRRAYRLLAGNLESRFPGIVESAKAGDTKLLARLRRNDVPLLYWSAASVFAAFGLNPLDFESAGNVGAAGLFLARAAELDPGWNAGAIYELYLSLYASLPSFMGGDPAKALESYEKSLALSHGQSASLFVAYATSICVPRQDYPSYRAALERALSIDPDARPETRLATVIAQKRARWLLDTADQYFNTGEGD
jgi:predicted anti-sigma-YlaC factor YlaD